MRERHFERIYSKDDLGITPAYAGKTTKTQNGGIPIRDHPRVCGKDRIAMTLAPSKSGSPPRMRERLVPDRRVNLHIGITPAYAGKTFFENVAQ